MSNRKLPFGYQMLMGQAAINDSEANLVREIFDRYVLGASYNEITALLKKQSVTYQPDKLWNKNMIARILEDRRYIGERDFPAIVQPETFRRAEEKRSFKQRPAQRTPAQRVLSSLCKSKVTAAADCIQ